MLKNSWVRHLILVLYLFQFLFITREYWRGKRDFFLLLPIIPFVKIKISWWNPCINFFVFIQFYLWSFSLEQRLPWSSWMNWMMTSMDAMKMRFVFFKKFVVLLGNINILNQFWWLFTFYLQNPETLLENNPEFFKKFTIVVATGLSER